MELGKTLQKLKRENSNKPVCFLSLTEYIHELLQIYEHMGLYFVYIFSSKGKWFQKKYHFHMKELF